MRILVTGSSGIIGREIVKKAVKAGMQVISLDREPWGGPKWSNLTSHTGDCADADLVTGIMEGCDSVIHLAAASSFLSYVKSPRIEFINTVESFASILEGVSRTGVKKLVHASTSAVYEGNPLPYVETMQLDPPDIKSVAKLVNERVAKVYPYNGAVSVISLRPFSVYGVDETSKGPLANAVSLFTWAVVGGQTPILWSDGTQTRDFIFAEDVADAFLSAASIDMPSQVLNLGTGVETNFRQLVAMISNHLDVEPSWKFRSTPVDTYAERLLADINMSNKYLGEYARTPMDAGVGRVVNFALRNIDRLKSEGWHCFQQGAI